ncbi:MAG TPA: hypothetical protein VKX39_13715 [Bryobacteraceae bacterium]|nr:hypothetical protein [Bryobacteraceae bacterium]
MWPQAAAVELSAAEIIHRSVEVNERDWKVGPSFSHVERDIEIKGGEKTDHTYEVFLMDGSPYRRLIAVDGQPLSAARQKQEAQKEGRELARRRAESPEERQQRIDHYKKDREHDHVLIIQMETAFNFRLAGDETLDGHPVYLLTAEPKPDYQPPNHEAKVLTGMKGKLWVDKAEFHWAKVEAEVVRPVTFAGFLAKVAPGTKFMLEKQPVAEHIWQPKKFADEVVASVLFWSKNSTILNTFSDYRPNGAISGLLRLPRAADLQLQRQEVQQVLQRENGNQLPMVDHH